MDKNLTSTTEATKYEWLDEAGLKKIITALLKVVNGNIKTSAYDDTAIKALIKGNTDAISTLNGTGAGSISQAVADGIATVVANAPDSFDTLKEIADWVKQDETATASLIQTVSAKADKSYVDEKYAQITSIDEGSIDTLF